MVDPRTTGLEGRSDSTEDGVVRGDEAGLGVVEVRSIELDLVFLANFNMAVENSRLFLHMYLYKKASPPIRFSYLDYGLPLF